MARFKVGDEVKVVATKHQLKDVGITLTKLKGLKGRVVDVEGDEWCEVLMEDGWDWSLRPHHLAKVVS